MRRIASTSMSYEEYRQLITGLMELMLFLIQIQMHRRQRDLPRLKFKAVAQLRQAYSLYNGA